MVVDDDGEPVAGVETNDPEETSEGRGVGQVGVARAGRPWGERTRGLDGQPDAVAVVACMRAQYCSLASSVSSD